MSQRIKPGDTVKVIDRGSYYFGALAKVIETNAPYDVTVEMLRNGKRFIRNIHSVTLIK